MQFIPEVKIGDTFGYRFKHQGCLLHKAAKEIGYKLIDAKKIAKDIEKIEDGYCEIGDIEYDVQ